MTTTGTTAAPSAGWYEDPRDAASARWWDGAAWTAHVRPRRAAPPAMAPSAAAPPMTSVAGPSTDVPAVPVPPWVVPAEQRSPEPSGWTPSSASALLPPSPTAGASWGSGTGRAWGPGGTGAAWVLAALPLIWIALRVVGSIIEAAGGTAATLVIGILSVPGTVLASLLLARRDGRQLSARGYRPPHQAWILLAAPVVYLGIRARRVREGGGRSVGPVVLGSISLAAVWIVVAGIVAVTFSLAMQAAAGRGAMYGGFDRSGAPEPGTAVTRADVERFIEDSENARYGVRVQVSCDPGDLAPLSAFTCSGVDSAGSPRSYVAKIAEGLAVTYEPGALDEGPVGGLGVGTESDDPEPRGPQLVTVRGTDAIQPNGEPVAGDPDGLQMVEFATVNLADRLGWTLENCTVADPASAPDRLACTAADPEGNEHSLAVLWDDASGVVRILRLS